MMRLGLLLGDRSAATEGDQSASGILEQSGVDRPWDPVSTRYNPDRAGSMPDRYTGQERSANLVPGRFTSHERSSSTPEKNTYQSSEDVYASVSSIGMSSEGTPDRGQSDASPISTLTG